MPKFSVGLPISEKIGFVDAVIEHKDRIGEVYFSTGNFQSGRSAQNFDTTRSAYEIESEQYRMLDRLNSEGLVFNALFNANCYGDECLSRSFFDRIGRTLDFLCSRYSVRSVTTTSPIIAKFVKNNFEGLETRASVNMEIGNREGFDYLSNYFDGYYLKREYNRYLDKIIEARRWCDENGKHLYCLANSGCLNFCSAHVFHDNIVAHEAGIVKYDNAYNFEGICHGYLTRDGNMRNYINRTNFVRPEDVHLIEDYFDGIKLATRVNSDPVSIIEAYTRGSFGGSVTSLLEPDHTGLFYPKIIENGRIPKDFASTVLHCDKNCAECGYCMRVCEAATISLSDDV